MPQLPPDCEVVLKTMRRDECMESRLVLDAAGILSQVHHWEGSWLLVVNRADLVESTEEIEAYRQENPVEPIRPRQEVPVYGGAVPGVLIYAGIIVLVAVVNAQSAFGFDWFAAGRIEGGKVTAGELWRTVTALTLHLDVGHLIGNVVFGTVFGLLAGRVLGGGVAWLAIVVAGALGNLINAWVQAPTHLSIGASTSVFAALGLLVSHALRPWGTADRGRAWKRWSPLIGGVLLLAYTGVGGERTDVVAHLTGFLAGLAIGWVGCRLPFAWLDSRKVQTCAGIAAITLVASSWIIALAAAGPR